MFLFKKNIKLEKSKEKKLDFFFFFTMIYLENSFLNKSLK